MTLYTVGSTTIGGGLGNYGNMNKVLYVNGRWWVFYDDGTDYGWRSSSDDGVTWSALTVYEVNTISEFAYWYDTPNNKICMVRTNVTDDDIHYRQGVLNADGTISWDAVEAEADSSITNPVAPCVCKDSDGYPWIGFSAGYLVYVIESTATDGSAWNAPVELWPYNEQLNVVEVVPLTGGKLLAVNVVGNDNVESRLYTGVAWDAAVEVSAEGPTALCAPDAVADGDDVHCAWKTSTTLYYHKYVYGSGWEGRYTVASTTTAYQPSISKLGSDKIRVYYIDGNLYYKDRLSGVWQASVEIDSAETQYQGITSSYGTPCGLAVRTFTDTSYNVKFAGTPSGGGESEDVTTIYVSLGGIDRSNIVKRIDIWRESLAGIGRFEVLLDNTGDALSGLTSQDGAVLRIDNVTLMKGYVDNYVPMIRKRSVAYYEEALVTGRDYGQDLANLMLEREYYDTKVDDIIDNALGSGPVAWAASTAYSKYDLVKPTTDNDYTYSCAVAGTSAAGEPTWLTTMGETQGDNTVLWQCGPRSEITYTSGSNLGTAKDVSFKNDHLLTKFLEITKLVNADFYVDDDKALKLFALSAATSSGVTLSAVAASTSNNILLLPKIGDKVGFDIRNYIHVEAGDVDDHWTEHNATDYTTEDCTCSDETTIYLAGSSSIKAVAGNAATIQFYIAFPKYNHTSLDLSEHVTCKLLARFDSVEVIAVHLKDGAAGYARYIGPTSVADKWTEVEFPVGEDTPVLNDAPAYVEGSWYGTAAFDWSDVVEIGLDISAFADGDIAYLDGLYIPRVTAKAISENAGGGSSQALYRKRMIRLSRPDVKSQVQLDAISADELEKRKDPLQQITLTAIGNTTLQYAGEKLVVNAPTSGISSVTYRSLKLHHAVEPGFNLLKGYDYITEVDAIVYSTTGVDPVRLKLSGSSAQRSQAQLQRLTSQVQALERMQR